MASSARETEGALRVAIVTPGGVRPDWTPEGVDTSEFEIVDPETDDVSLVRSMDGATAAFIDGDVSAPLSVARRLNRLVPGLQLAIVAREDDHRRLRRSMLFTPGLGEVWIVPPEDVTADLFERSAGIGRSRRAHARRSPRVARQVAGFDAVPGRRPFLADQYLATLLELLPDPVMALDDDGAVVFTNTPAAEILAIDRKPSVSADELREALRPVDPSAWDDLLARGRYEVVGEEVEVGSGESRRIYSASVAPVAGERPVRAVLLHDVTEQVETREELAARAEELREVMEHRSRFYASMSHELRTPINAIVGYVDLLDADVYGSVPEGQKEALERIARATRHLLDLVDDTLDLSKVEAGKLRLRPERIEVDEVMRDLEVTMGPLADESGADLRIDIHESCSEGFSTDPQRLRQILANLLSNAIRYGEGAPVDLQCRIEDRTLIVEVKDQGPGIPEDERERVFEEFVQLEEEQENGGTGLGLPISRTLAEALGGTLSLEAGAGKGSVFRVELPWLEEEDEHEGEGE